MTKISIYDDDAEKLEEVAEKLDLPVAEVVYCLMDFISEIEED